MRVLLKDADECKEYDGLSLYPKATRGECSNSSMHF
jgi:hypothetical protein